MSSIPPSEPASFRHLGSGGPRPMRSPMALLLVIGLVVVALPIYLFRRPKPIPVLGPDAGAATGLFDAGAEAAGVVATTGSDAGAGKRMTLGDPKMIRCVPKSGRHSTTDRCDHVSSIEDALGKAIRDNVACAPPSATPFTVSFVLTADFERKRLHLWAGRSGSLKKRSSQDLVRCVEHAIAQPEWGTVAHQFMKYDINVMASYPGTTGVGTVPMGGM